MTEDVRQLHAEHRQIAEMARELAEAVAAPTPPEPIAFLHFRREFARILTRHLKREEWMTWPLLAARPDAAQLCSDLAAFSLDFAAYGRAWPAPRIEGDWEGFRRETLAMIERLLARIEAEETQLYPLLAARGRAPALKQAS